MFKYILKRILSIIPVIFIITVVVFSITKIMPGDPVENQIIQSKVTNPEDKARLRRTLREAWGLDKSVPEQYIIWVSRIAKGDLGQSTQFNKPVIDAVKTPMINTISLNVFVIFFSLTISIYAGIKSAVKQGTLYDQFWQVFSLVTTSVPTFFIGLVLIYIFAIKLKLLPTGGMPSSRLHGTEYLLAWFKHLILPTITLTIISLAGTIRYVRNAMLDVLNQDFIRTARAKGLSQKVVIYSHAFRNALIPVVTIVIGSIGSLFAGSTITETVFSWSGIGRVLVTSLSSMDYNMIIALNLFSAVIFVLTNFITDLSYAFVDPRVKLK